MRGVTQWLTCEDKQRNQEGEKDRRAAQFESCLDSRLRALAHEVFSRSLHAHTFQPLLLKEYLLEYYLAEQLHPQSRGVAQVVACRIN